MNLSTKRHWMWIMCKVVQTFRHEVIICMSGGQRGFQCLYSGKRLKFQPRRVGKHNHFTLYNYSEKSRCNIFMCPIWLQSKYIIKENFSNTLATNNMGTANEIYKLWKACAIFSSNFILLSHMKHTAVVHLCCDYPSKLFTFNINIYSDVIIC
jgi:hypothetical protein